MNKKKEERVVWPRPPIGMPLNPLGTIITDPMGGYTGRPIDPDDIPVQDADDL